MQIIKKGYIGEQQAIFEQLDVGMSQVILSENIDILWCNHYFYESLCYQEQVFLSLYPDWKHCLFSYPEEFQKLKELLFMMKSQHRKKQTLTVHLPHHEKTIIWAKLTITLLEGAIDDHPVYSILFTDIDDVMRELENIRASEEEREENFKWMMSEYAGNVYMSDMDTYELLYVNKMACQTLQHSADEVIGKKCYEVIQGRTSPCPFCTNNRLNREQTYEWEFFNPNLNRTFMIKNRELNWHGHRTRIELSYDMFSAEYKLAKKDQEREAILQTIPGALARLDARDFSKILWYNGRLLDMIGYTTQQFESELNSRCTYMKEEDFNRASQLAQTLTKTGDNVIFEANILTRDKEERILMITLCYISGEDSWDGIPSYYSIALDITKDRVEQARQRKALEEAYDTARVASQAKTNFLSSMSHDIRTPMNAIVGMATIAQANIDSQEKVHDCLNKINISSRHLLSLINEVLDMSKIESGKIDLMLETVELSELVENISNICRPMMNRKQQDFKIVIDCVNHEKIITDGDRLQQICMNLLSNAMKYTPEHGHISLQIHEVPSLIPGKGRFEFIFTDDGIGMSEEFIPHIFEAFSRAEDSRISKIQGTGLGMAITENIVHMMNGTIEVKSELGKGSQFIVSIPLQIQEEEQKIDEQLSGNAVLVVDDDQIVCENAVLLLNELGMRGKWVLSGREAITYVIQAHEEKNDFFAVILDWKMPDLSGLDTLRIIRKELGDDIPIIIISAYDFTEIEEEFVKAGADAFITKPLFKSKMLHVLELFCTSNRLDNTNAVIEETYSSLCGKRVLLAEDNELNREIAVELLALQGILVDCAQDGIEALDKYKASDLGYYTAILMDIQMPKMDGYEATKAIRQLDREDAKEIPIIALTANAFLSDVISAQSAGMNDHVAKPIDVEHLVEVLQKYIK